MKIKKIGTLLICVLLTMTMFAISAFASEVPKFEIGTTPGFYSATGQITPQHEEHMQKTMSGEIDLKAGEDSVVTEFDDGVVLYVRVID